MGAFTSDKERKESENRCIGRLKAGSYVKDCRPAGRPLAVASSANPRRRKRVGKTDTGQGHVSAFSSLPG